MHLESKLGMPAHETVPQSGVVAGTAAQFGALIRSEAVRLGRVVKESGATPD